MARRKTVTLVVEVAILIAIWWVLSGIFDLLHFGTGVVAAILIAAASHDIDDGMRFRFGQFLLYVPWLILQIVISNLRVARLVFSRRMPIRPVFISEPPAVKGDRALTVLAASTTLTPGTLTVDVSRDEIFIHALDEKSARDTRDQLVARHVARVFVERGA
jgi:multicomponent Na+:H+ antiporter subunit E